LILRKILICTIKSGKTIGLQYATGIYEIRKYTNFIKGCRDVTGRGLIVALCNFYELRSIPTDNHKGSTEVRNDIAMQFVVTALYAVKLEYIEYYKRGLLCKEENS
jgi:hypothetical protein